MQKRVYLIHGWGGKPEGGFRQWLKRELESRGYEVHPLAMPDADTPRIEQWIPFLLSTIQTPDENTILVGHSMGCQAILRYLEALPEGSRVGKVVLVAGFIERLTDLDAEEQVVAKPWLETPINFEKVRRAAQEIVAFFSDNDRWVPIENERAMRDKLGARTIVEHARGHWSDTEDRITEVPTILAEIIS